MVDTVAAQSPANPSPSNPVREPVGRDRLAQIVVVASFLAIFAMVFALFVLAGQDSGRVAELAEKTFNTILPVLAAWVGTVLAFYFSARSNERTSDSLNEMIARTTGSSPGSSVTVAEKMIPFGLIRESVNLKETRPDTTSLSDLKKRYKPSDGSVVTRLIFHEAGLFSYVLHESTLDAFLGKLAAESPPRLEATFADLLSDAESLHKISKLVVFVAPSTTLREAKTALDAVPGAQDIIVTATGNANGPMLGWITHSDLIKVLPVS
jgi:hypothetical protein